MPSGPPLDADYQGASTYHVGPRTLAIVYQELSTVEADALVSSDDNHLTMGGGVSARLAEAGGRCVHDHARKFVPPLARSPLRRGEVVVTTAGALPARYVLHAVTLDLDAGKAPDERVIRDATSRCMELAESLGLASIAFPALGTGVGGFPFQRAAEVMIRTITVALDSASTVDRATIALFARPGVSRSELNVFYENAVGQVALWQQTKRLAQSLDDLEVSGAVPPDELERLLAVRDEVRDAVERLDASPPIGEERAPGAEATSLVELGQRISAGLANVRDPSERSDDPRAREAAARAALEELRFEHNATLVLLTKLQTDRALGGARGPESDQRIAEVTDKVKDLSARIADTARRLELVTR